MAERKRPTRKRANGGPGAADPPAMKVQKTADGEQPQRQRQQGQKPSEAAAAAAPSERHADMPASAKEFVLNGGLQQPREFASLREYAAKSGRFLRVDDTWVDAVHGTPPLPASGLWGLLTKLIQNPLQTVNHAPRFAAAVHQTVAAGARLLAPDVPMTTFPGPMARPLTRRLDELVKKHQYWLTEKSDGLRVMLQTRFVPHFPRWSIQTANGLRPLFLYDAILLEYARESMAKAGAEVSSFGMPLSKGLRGEQRLALKVRREPQGELLYLVDEESKREAPMLRSREPGYGFAYAIDRSMDVFLLLDDFTVPGKSVLLDGELTHNLLVDKTQFLIYDIVSEENVGGPDALSFAAAAQATLYGSQNMSVRVAAMAAVAKEQRDFFAKVNHAPFIEMRAKRFYAAREAPALLAKIRKEGPSYIYNGENHNDGVVLTPERGDLIQFRPGTSLHLLKYKFPDMLTVDWQVRFCREVSTTKLWTLAYLVKDRDGTTKEWYEEHADFKTAPLKLYQSCKPPATDRAVIAECRYLPPSGYWAVKHIREDKTNANSYLTASSVLESVAEQYTTQDLLDTAAVSPDGSLDDSVVRKPVFVSPPVGLAEQGQAAADWRSPRATFILRTHKDPRSADPNVRRLTLQIRTKTSRYHHPRSFAYVSADETFGLSCPCPNLHPDSQLLPLLYIEVANNGGCASWSETCCEAKFVPACGRWEILYVGRSPRLKDQAGIRNLLFHLEETCQKGPSPYKAPSQGVVSVRGALVASDKHYAAKATDKTLSSERSRLREFNNWVKSTFIANASAWACREHVVSAEDRDTVAERKLTVLDMCCGRGGDIFKWAKTKPRFYVGTDSCLEAVGAAAQRYSDGSATSVNNKMSSGMP
eukprot:gene9068-14040_t